MMTDCLQQLTLWDLGPQQVTVTFQGGRIVSDAGLLGIRKLDKELGVLSLLAERLPDPRVQNLVVHSRESLFTQQVYQILAGYPDCNDAQTLRNDPLFHTLLDLPAEEDAKPLASGSTLARFAQAFTRREADLPLEERPVLLEVATAQNQRLKILNDYLSALFIRTRRTQPAYIIAESAFCGHQYVGTSARPLSVFLRTTRRRAGTADRRIEKRFVGRPLVVSSFPRQLVEAAGTRDGICLGDLASRSDGRDPRSGPGASEHLANEAVEGWSHRQDERAPHLVSLLGNVAAP